MTAAASVPGRWLVYLRLGRVSNLPTVWTNCLAGLFLSGATPGVGSAVLLIVSLSCFYTGGMFFNDAFDAPHDRQLRPERPIPSGHIAVAEVYVVGFVLLGLGEALLALVGPLRGGPASVLGLLGGAVLAALIVYYDASHKRNPLSPLVMALCRAMVYGTVAAALAPSWDWLAAAAGLRWGILVLVGYLIGLTYIAKQEFRKQEQLRRIANLWPLLFLLAPFAYRAPALSEGLIPAALYLGLLVWVAHGLSLVLFSSRRNVGRAVAVLIAGISLLDGLLMAGVGAPDAWLAAAVFAWALTLVFQRFISGT